MNGSSYFYCAESSRTFLPATGLGLVLEQRLDHIDFLRRKIASNGHPVGSVEG